MKSIVVPEKEFGVHEECGIIGIKGKEKSFLAREIYFGLFALQHRGQESAGIAVSYDKTKIAYYKNMGLLNDVFGEEELGLLPKTDCAVGHVRYSAKGSSNVANAQPVVFYGKFGRMAISHNGNVINADILKEKMLEAGHIFQSSTDAEVIAASINQHSVDGIVSGIKKACQTFIGAFAVLIMAEGRLYAVRDRHALKPLIMGEKNGNIIFASESCALDAIEAKIIRDVEPGELVIVEDDGSYRSEYIGSADNRRPCVFEYVYLARSDSVIDSVSVYDSRFKCGQTLAGLFKIDADIVAGVPDSALVCAHGYSEASGIPYVDALSKNRYIGRTFIQPSQSMRESSVKIKLTAFRNNINGKRLILIDDSIVRGTTSKKIINLLRQNGAKEVHMIIASPMVKNPCFFGVDMDTHEQLIAASRTKEEIRGIIGADSLNYIPLESLVECCGGGGFCTGCFDGNYAVNIEGIK